jgi:hypothetical protein
MTARPRAWMTRAGPRLAVSLIVVMLAGARRPIAAHTEAPVDFPTLVSSADAIVRGHVTDVRGTTTPGGDIVSLVTVAVDGAIKGEIGAFVSVVVPGGEMGRVRAVMPGVPRLHVQDAAVWLLRRGPDGVWRLASLTAGLYPLRRESGSGRIVVDPPVVAGRTAAAGLVERGDRLRRPMSVPEFEAFVRLVGAARVQPIRRGRP